MSYQSTDAERPGMKSGWNTTPAVQVSAFSGLTLGLPPEKRVTLIASITPGVRGSSIVATPPVLSNRSERFAARTSRE